MATMVSRPSKLRIDDWYFTGMSVVVLGIVLLGFARTYYLAGAIHAPLPSVIIHIHAVAFSSWIVLLIAQTLLVTAGRTGWHKKVGILGAILAPLMVLLGLAAAIDTQKRHTTIPGIDPPGSSPSSLQSSRSSRFLSQKALARAAKVQPTRDLCCSPPSP